MLHLLLLGCGPTRSEPEPSPQASAPEVYGDGGIRPAGGVSAFAWGPGGTVVVAPADPDGVLATGDGAWGFASYGNFALLDPTTGAETSSFAAPCFWATPLAANPGFPLVAVRCGTIVHAIDPRSGHDTIVADESSDVRIGGTLTILNDQRLEVFDGALARVATYELPFTPLWWNAVGSLIAAVGEVSPGARQAPVAWRSPRGVGTTTLNGVTAVDAFATDGRRLVVLSGSVLHWFDTGTRRWIGETAGVSLAAPAWMLGLGGDPLIGFVGDDLWFATLTGWRRLSGPDTELSPVESKFRGAAATFSSSGVIVAAPTALHVRGPEGQPMGVEPPWLSLRGVGLSGDGETLAAVTDDGVVLVDRDTRTMTAWRDGATQAWLSGDGGWLAETDGALGRVWLRDLAGGTTHEMTGIPTPNTDGAIEGPGWIMHGRWSADGSTFVGIWRGWARGWIRAWRRGLPEPFLARELAGLSVGHDLQDEIWLVSPDGTRFMTPDWGGLRVETADPGAAPKTLAFQGLLDAAVVPDGTVFGLACDVDHPRPTTNLAYRCQRITASDGSGVAFQTGTDVRLSADGSLVFAADGDAAVNVFSANGLLLRRVELVTRGQWPDHSPWADGAVADRSIVIPLSDGRVQVIDGER